MARRKREPMSEGKKNIIGMLLEEYDIKSAKDIEDALKDLLGRTIQEMLESEMDEHLGYKEYERSDNPDYRNGRKTKKIRSNFGETEIEVPQDRDGTFEPKVVKKRQKDISGIEQKIISLYAKGMTTRQISETIEDIYGFEVSDGLVSWVMQFADKIEVVEPRSLREQMKHRAEAVLAVYQREPADAEDAPDEAEKAEEDPAEAESALSPE